MKRVKNFKMKGLLIAVILFLSLAVSTPVLSQDGEVNLDEVKLFLETFYVEEINWETVDTSSLESLLKSIGDPYTSYLTPKEYDQFLEHFEGSFGGIGIHIEQLDGYVTVVAPIEDTPAFDAGLKPKDKILSVNGIDVVNVPLDQAASLIRGEPGTEVELTIDRAGEKFILKIERNIIEIISVRGELKEDKVGYMRITTFGENTLAEMVQTMAELEKQGAKGYIIDLRNNGGGLLNAALAMAEELIPKGPVVHVVDRQGTVDSYYTNGAGIDEPVVVLVNKGSASAAEILAAAIQENNRGIVVGTETFGKASVQSLVNLRRGGVLKLTTAHYLTPLGNSIDGVGIKPDFIVEEEEAQLRKAVGLLLHKTESVQETTFEETNLSIFIGKNKGYINGREVFLANPPLVKNGRSYLPVRFISESIGMSVDWNNNNRTAKIHNTESTVLIDPVNNRITVDGNEKKMTDPILFEAGRIYLPVRFFIESIGGEVEWVKEAGEIKIKK